HGDATKGHLGVSHMPTVSRSLEGILEIEQAQLTVAAEPTASPVWVRLLFDALFSVGFDARSYSRRQGWDADRLPDPDTQIPWRDMVELWTAAALSTGNPHVGIHAADNFPLRIGSPLGYLVASGATLLDSLSMIIRYQCLHFDQPVLSLDDRRDHLAL